MAMSQRQRGERGSRRAAVRVLLKRLRDQPGMDFLIDTVSNRRGLRPKWRTCTLRIALDHPTKAKLGTDETKRTDQTTETLFLLLLVIDIDID
jgi:hypothetical protein